jgi:hypothetical protein
MVNQGSYDLRHDVDRLQNKVNVFENTFTDSYFIETSVPAIFYKDNTFSPTSITFYSYSENKGKITTYKGQIKISTSIDGVTYTEVKTSTDSNTTITLSDNTIKYIKCQLYDTNKQLLDTQTVPVLKDGSDGTDGSSPISLFLGNESQLIPCTSEGIVDDYIVFDIPFYCYKGTKMYPCTYNKGTEFSDLGMDINNVVQGTSTQNGYIGVYIPYGEDLTGLKHSIISLNFTVDGETIVKEFNWAKIIKGADGEDGQTPTLYTRYSYNATPSTLSDTSKTEVDGWDYRGVCWVYDGVEPTDLDSYKPFTLYNPSDGVKGENGYVHIAYSMSADGSEKFTTGQPKYTPLYMGTLTDNQSGDVDDYKKYKWTKIKGEDGADGITPSEDTIQEIVKNTDINATTLNGNTEDSFIPAKLPSKTIYRDDSVTNKNYIKLYRIGQVVLCQLINFSDDDGAADYGQDPNNSSYFKLMPDKKVIPAEWLPSSTLFINDLNLADGSTNGRLRLNASTGMVTKLGTSGTSYNNTYGTFIYPIIPRTDTVLTASISTSIIYGESISATVKTSDGTAVSNVPVSFKLVGSGNAYDLVGYTNSNGVASVQLNTAPDTYTITVQCKGNNVYNQSNTVTQKSTVTKTALTLNATYNSNMKAITVYAYNSQGTPLPNLKISLGSSARTAYTNYNGYCYFNVTSDGTYTVYSKDNAGVDDSTTTVTVTGFTPTYTTTSESKVPQYAFNVNATAYAKKWDNTQIGRVQNKEDVSSIDYAMYCIVNGRLNGITYNTQPAPIQFNCFKFSNLNKKPSKVTVTVSYAVFPYGGSITNLSMVQPDVYLKTINGGRTIASQTSSSDIASGSTYHTITFSTTDVTNAEIISDNLCVEIDAKTNYCSTSGSYNKVTFRVDYVNIVAEYTS